LSEELADMAEGSIKKLVMDKGYGFIAGERGDMFFHFSAVQEGTFEDLSVGQRVQYEISDGPKGPRAESVVPLD
jgi:CspA family cold shock protein